jgi:hypothetical protein
LTLQLQLFTFSLIFEHKMTWIDQVILARGHLIHSVKGMNPKHQLETDFWTCSLRSLALSVQP